MHRASVGGRRRESYVWEYFRYDVAKGKSICLCTDSKNGPAKCGKELKGKNPTNLKTHLESYHLEEFNKFIEKEKLRAKPVLVNTFSYTSPTKMTLRARVEAYATENSKYSEVDMDKLNAVVKLFAATSLPTSLLDDPVFKEFLNVLDQQFKPPSRTEIESMTEQLLTKTHENIQNAITAASIISLSTDLWTKRGINESYMVVSCSYYDEHKAGANHAILNISCIPHPTTLEDIDAILDETMMTWKFSYDKVALIITDNGANMVKGIHCMKGNENITIKCEQFGTQVTNEVTSLDEDDEEEPIFDIPIPSQFMRLPCFPHTLQLVVSDLERHEPYANLCMKTRALINRVKKSPNAMQLLKEKCQLTLISDCPSRWCSTYLMISRLIEIRDAFNDVLNHQGLDGLVNSEWKKLELLEFIFGPFANHVKMLESDTMSLSYMLPAVLDLEEHLKECENTHALNNDILEESSLGFVTSCSEILLESLSSRFRYIRDVTALDFNVLPASATLLDLRYNWIFLLSANSGLLKMAKTYISKKMNNTNNFDNQIQDIKHDLDSGERPSKRFKHLVTLAMPLCGRTANFSMQSEADVELVKYVATLNNRRLPEEEDSIAAWSKHTDLPLLAQFACNILALPCSEAFVESIFSICGVFADKMNKSFEKCDFLKYNLRLIE